MSGSSGTNVSNQVEGVAYDENLGAFQPTLAQLLKKQTQDTRNKLTKLRDGYTANLRKLKKPQCEQLFREAQAAGMKKTTTECSTMPLKKTAILEFYIEAFAQHGIEMKDAPIFNPRKAPNDRKRKVRQNKTKVTPSSTTSSSTSRKKSHRTTADAYEVMGSFNWEYRQTHGLILVGRGRTIRIRCSACCKTFKEGVQ